MGRVTFGYNKDESGYSDELKDRALEIYQESGPKEAEKETGISKSWISKLASKRGLNIGKRALNRKQVEELVDLRKNKGYSYADIAEHFDISDSTARNYVKSFVDGEDRGLYHKKLSDQFPTFEEYNNAETD